MFEAFIISFVESLSTQFSDITSEMQKSSSSVLNSTGPSQVPAGLLGEYAATFMPNAIPIFATFLPIVPYPIIPSVLPAISVMGLMQ